MIDNSFLVSLGRLIDCHIASKIQYEYWAKKWKMGCVGLTHLFHIGIVVSGKKIKEQHDMFSSSRKNKGKNPVGAS